MLLISHRAAERGWQSGSEEGLRRHISMRGGLCDRVRGGGSGMATILHFGHDERRELDAALIHGELAAVAELVALFSQDLKDVSLLVHAQDHRLGPLQLERHAVEEAHHKLVQWVLIFVSPALLLPVLQFRVRQRRRSPYVGAESLLRLALVGC